MLNRIASILSGKSQTACGSEIASPGTSNQTDFEEIRMLSKKQIELMEHWARRLIDELLKSDYGSDYINARKPNGEYLVKSSLRARIEQRKQSDPGRFPRSIDAILLEDVGYFFSKEEFCEAHFKQVMEPFYSGPEEVRRVVGRLISVRNKLYHDNHISIREAEQVLCYTNDIIETIKEYYAEQGRERDLNVPTFLCVSDSQGNRVFRREASYSWTVLNVPKVQLPFFGRDGHQEAISTSHRSGESYEVELEVDTSFPSDTYTVLWALELGGRPILSNTGTRIVIDFTDEMVSFEPEIHAKLVTNAGWHRFANIGCDDEVSISLSKVLPPIEDCY